MRKLSFMNYTMNTNKLVIKKDLSMHVHTMNSLILTYKWIIETKNIFHLMMLQQKSASVWSRTDKSSSQTVGTNNRNAQQDYWRQNENLQERKV